MGGGHGETRDALEILGREGRLRPGAIAVAQVCVVQMMSIEDPTDQWLETVVLTSTDPDTVAGMLAEAAEQAAHNT